MPDRKIRVVYVHHDGVMSGSAISLRTLLKSLDRTRFEPSVVLAAPGPAQHLFAEIDAPVVVVPMRSFVTQPSPSWHEWDYRNNWLALSRSTECETYFRASRPDIVHVNDKAALAGGRAASAAGVPVVWHLRSSYVGARSPLQTRISRTTIRRIAAKVIAISEDETDGFEDLAGLRVIYNAVERQAVAEAVKNREGVRVELGLKDVDVAVGMVGQMNSQKGAWDFIEAAGRVRRQLPEVSLRFVMIAPIPGPNAFGGGLSGRLGIGDVKHPQDQLRELSAQAGLNDLILAGGRSDFLTVMAAMDIVSCCYRMHAIGRPAFEAMALGRPVITNAGHTGRSAVVRDGETALVVHGGDVAGLTAAISSLARDPLARRRMGELGASYARDRFDDATHARRVEAVYDEVLKQVSA
jgi:glycosyltransferase involved in cell wall biosynthesis